MLVVATLYVYFELIDQELEHELTILMLLSFLGISQSLPSTSYIKLIEIWMIFTMIYPFAETLMVCFKDAFKSKTLFVRGASNEINLQINY